MMEMRLCQSARLSADLLNDIADRRVERCQLERLEEHPRVHPLKEKFDRRIVLVASKKK